MEGILSFSYSSQNGLNNLEQAQVKTNPDLTLDSTLWEPHKFLTLL